MIFTTSISYVRQNIIADYDVLTKNNTLVLHHYH